MKQKVYVYFEFGTEQYLTAPTDDMAISFVKEEKGESEHSSLFTTCYEIQASNMTCWVHNNLLTKLF